MKKLITISVPDNIVKLQYITSVEGSVYLEETKPVTFDMIVKVEKEFEISDIIQTASLCDGAKEATS